MPTFKNIQDILLTPWDENFSKENSFYPYLPKSVVWDQIREITISDVTIWEQIYYESGNVGIYAAYNPHSELYLITYNLFFYTNYKFEVFYGDSAAQECYDRAVELGISLDFI